MQSENLGKPKQQTSISFRQWNKALATCYALCCSYPVGRPGVVVRVLGRQIGAQAAAAAHFSELNLTTEPEVQYCVK